MSEWVLLLGGSTGHGAATAKRLARDGFGIIAFHFDRGDAKKIAEETITERSLTLLTRQIQVTQTRTADQETTNEQQNSMQANWGAGTGTRKHHRNAQRKRNVIHCLPSQYHSSYYPARACATGYCSRSLCV